MERRPALDAFAALGRRRPSLGSGSAGPDRDPAIGQGAGLILPPCLSVAIEQAGYLERYAASPSFGPSAGIANGLAGFDAKPGLHTEHNVHRQPARLPHARLPWFLQARAE